MRVIRGAAAAISAVVVMAGQAGAQAVTPAEPPPPDFSGNQYVDSAGCVFMRGEIGGTVTWLPRLNRDRQQVCGYDPSYSSGMESEPAVAAAPEPEEANPAAPGKAEPETPAPNKTSGRYGKRRTVSVAPAMAEACPCFVQVGAFAVPSNADRMAERLLTMGLRVTIVRERLDRRPIRSVLAGPFEDEAAHRDAILRLRQAGFADAFRRRQPVHMP